MNLSDLVHRTAGDNKVLTTTTNGTSRLPQGNNDNLFQQAITSPSNSTPTTTTNNNNVFTNLTRQDQSAFLFSMPNMSQTDWMNSNLFFNNSTDSLIEPIPTATTTTTTAANITPTNSTANSFLKQDLSFTSSFLNQQATKPIINNTQQRTYQPPTIAPYPTTQNIFHRFDLPLTTPNNTTTTTNTNTKTTNNVATTPNTLLNDAANTANTINTAAINTTSTLNNGMTATKSITTPMNNSKPLNNTLNTTTTTTATTTLNNLIPLTSTKTAINTATATSSPTTNFNTLQQQQQQQQFTTDSPSSTTTTSLNSPSSSSSPAPVMKKPPEKKLSNKVTVTGDNVSADNIEDGYIQFVLNHDPNYINDGIESLMYAKRKFSSVPKTGDLSYTTWDIYELVLKLHKREIKNWSQLVGQLGLADMAGRPQFAQRVKRWMHRYKIDCYFDYLLGNKYYFNAPNEKYSGCLMVGNYKKRGLNLLEEERPVESQSDEEGFDQINDEYRIPILLAGSRKRMRDHSQNSQQMIENARQFLRTNQSSDEEEDEEEEDEDELNQKTAMDTDDSDDDDDEVGENQLDVNMKNNDDDDDDDEEEEEEEEEEEDEVDEVDEEDELASTSSSPGSPATRVINSSPKLVAISSPLIKKVSPIILPTSSACSNYIKNETEISAMKKEISQLKAYISTLESKVQEQSTMTAQMNKLLRLRDRTERWRKQLIEDLARGPLLVSDDDNDDNDDDVEEEEEDETTDGDA